jgi:hypothetical protein
VWLCIYVDSQQIGSVPPPRPLVPGGTHSLAGEGVGESKFRRWEMHCGTFYIYALCGSHCSKKTAFVFDGFFYTMQLAD